MANDRWNTVGEESSGLSHRQFESYSTYVELQQSKLEFLNLDNHETRFRRALAERLRGHDFVRRGSDVICLGARLGAEVHAFHDCGCFAVGVDLNPGTGNPVVLPGDFHHLVFPDASCNIVYTNSLDHCFELSRLCEEVRRVLMPDGIFLVEADPGGEDEGGLKPDTWASLAWNSIDELAAALTRYGFHLVQRSGFDYPRGGEQLVLRAKPPVE